MLLKTRIFMIVSLAAKFSVIYGLKEQECGTMEIRFYSDLNKLQNCTAILGNLALFFPSVVEVGEYTDQEVNSWTFPLREITGFMLVHSVTGLNSLGKMFPNLTVIRGQRLFSNYAFVIYETDLTEVCFTTS